VTDEADSKWIGRIDSWQQLRWRRDFITTRGVFASDLIVQTAGESSQRGRKLWQRRATIAARNADQVEGRQSVLRQSKGFTQEALPTIPRHGRADLTRDRQTQPWMVEAVGGSAHAQETVGREVASVKHTAEICRLEEVQLF
jgi:hypothetical protein